MTAYALPSTFSLFKLFPLSTILCFLLLLSLHATVSLSAINSIDELKEFFKTTYIRKEIGSYKTSIRTVSSRAKYFGEAGPPQIEETCEEAREKTQGENAFIDTFGQLH